MSTYEELKGLKIKYLSADTSGDRKVEGEVFYNSTDFNLKSFVATAAFSSGAPLITARTWIAATGTQTAALYSGGTTAPNTRYNNTEEYNGTGFSAGGNLNTAKGNSGAAGTQTAGLQAYGNDSTGTTADAEEYNGTSWTNVTDAPGASRDVDAFGIQTAAVFLGGNADADSSYEYDGTNWTAGNNMGTSRYTTATAGTLTAGLGAGGYNPGVGNTANTETYDGTSWTEVGNLTIAKRDGASGGTQSAAFFAGGAGTPGGGDTHSNAQQLWNGTTWSNSPATLATARRGLRGTGASSSAGIGAGGYTPSINAATGVSLTEEFNISLTATTAAAWSSGGNMNTSRRYMAGLGTRPAALAAGGSTSSPGLNETANSEEYNGSSWTEGNNLNTARVGLGGAGSQTSSIAAGGRTPGNIEEVSSEEYNGSSWTATPNLNTGRRYVAGFGASETAAVVVGGTTGGAPGAGTKQTATEEYNGSSWTAGGSMNTAKTGTDGNSVGTETAGLYITGNAGVEEYNGTAWTEVNDLNRAAPGNGGGACGIQTSALFAGATPYAGTTESYDGTSFITAPSLATGRMYSGGAGASSPTGTIFGGRNSPSSPRTTNVTEEFTAETTTARAAKTIDFD